MQRVVIVGAGHGAGQVAASLIQKKFDGSITMIGEEPWYPYQRPPLSKKYLAGEMPAERLYFKPVSFYEDAVDVVLGSRVTAIDRQERRVSTAAGIQYPYDALVLAVGGPGEWSLDWAIEIDGVTLAELLDGRIGALLAAGGVVAAAAQLATFWRPVSD